MKVTIALLALMQLLLAAPTDKDLVVVTRRTKRGFEDETGRYDLGSPEITHMHITSSITNRFAQTLVKSKVKNEKHKPQETVFFVVLPERAYISSFVMEIDGKNYTAHVEEKGAANKTYQQAVSKGFGAAHVTVRDSKKFAVNLNIEPQTKAVFYLTYEELLQRKKGRYEQVINIHPMQLVKDLRAEVVINETRPLTLVATPSIRSGNKISKESVTLSPHAHIFRPNETSALITFRPDIAKQRQIARALGIEEEEGIRGQFVVQYDVERDPYGGDVLFKDGYFVHFFAPSVFQPLNKHVVFVLDTSISMSWGKMEQLRTAMRRILDDLRPNDYFNLIEFNSEVKVWNLDAPEESTILRENADNFFEYMVKDQDLDDFIFPPPYPANADNIAKAKNAIDNMNPIGFTNIYDALRVAIKLPQHYKKVQSLVFFLTDGDPTVGRTNASKIISYISEQNKNGIPIIALSFGKDADKKFLKNIADKNKGLYRHIYEDSDASLQLENFYRDISSPLLTDVEFTYSDEVTSLSKVDFPLLYDGSELVVTGRLDEPDFDEFPLVKCKTPTMNWHLLPTVGKAVGQLERLWAYMTVQKYLDDNTENATMYRDKALELALKYSFITSVTSLVVIKPKDTIVLDTDPNEEIPTWISQSYSNRLDGSVAIAESSSRAYPFQNRPGLKGFLPVRPRISPVTTTSTTAKAPIEIPNLPPELAWIGVYFESDGRISFLKGSYLLGLNQTSPENQHCTTPSSEEGRCRLIKDCQQLHPLLIDVKSFKRNFCAVNGRVKLVGICCPEKNEI